MRPGLFTPLLFHVLFGIACGPGRPADTESTSDDPSSSSGADTLPGGTSMEPPDPTTGGPVPTTDSPDTTAGPDPTDTTAGPDTTGGSDECLKGQVLFAPQWSTVLAPPFEFEEVHPEGGMAVLADGRTAIGVKIGDGEQHAGGVLFLSPTGELLDIHPAAFGGNGPIHGLARAANDELVLAGRRLADVNLPTWTARFASDGAQITHIPVDEPRYFDAAMGLFDTAVLLGLDEVSMQTRAVKFVADGTGLEWSLTMDGPPGTQGAAVATREDGSVLLVTQSNPGQGGYSWLGLRLVNSAGATVWTQQLDGPGFGRATHAAAIPDGWVVLRSGDWVGGVVRLTAVSASDGATLWDTEVAVLDDQGPPLATRVHLTGDLLTVPVLRSLAAHPVDLSEARSVAAHRLSLQGAPIDVTPLPGAETIDGSWDLDSAAGPCGELVVLAPGGDRTWVGGYAP